MREIKWMDGVFWMSVSGVVDKMKRMYVCDEGRDASGEGGGDVR